MSCSINLPKLLSSSLFMAAFTLTATASRAEGITFEIAPPPACDSSDASCIIIEQSQSNELSEFGKIEFVAVREDSRCPIDVLCFWEGQVKVELKRTYLGSTEKFVVGLGSNLANEYVDIESGKKIVLEQVWPERIFSNPVEKPYQIKLRLEDPSLQEEQGPSNDAGQSAQQDQDVIAD